MKKIYPFLLLCFTLHLLSCGGKYTEVENSIKELSSNNPEIPILNWRIIGPFKDTACASHILSLATPLDTLGHEIKRDSIIDTLYKQRNGFIMDLADLYDSKEKNTAYALSIITAARAGEVAFLIGVDDNIRLWVNDKLHLATEGSRGLRKNQIIKKIFLNKGDNAVVAEISSGGGPWSFRLDIATIQHVTYNALQPGYFNSSLKPTVEINDSLHIDISNPEFISTINPCRLEIYDINENLVLEHSMKMEKDAKICLNPLLPGIYTYKLYTDLDTLDGIFSYGSIEKIYSRSALLSKYKYDTATFNLLNPYIKRLDHLLKFVKKDIDHSLSKRIVLCLHKIKEIDHKAEKDKSFLESINGFQLRTFTSSIDSGDDYYLLYTPKNQKKIPNKGIPLMVIVPYVTSGHEFYRGNITANIDRLEYIFRFAEMYGMAVVWPSARIYVRYNTTPIVTKAIEETINDVNKTHAIDRQNVLFYGDCSGGLFALLAAIQNPELCSALVLDGPDLRSIALSPPNGTPSAIANDIYGLLDNIVDKPIKIFQSINDEKSDYARSVWLLDELKKRGGCVEFHNLRENSKGNGIAKMISEPEGMRETFDFFQADLNRKQKTKKRYVSYAAYRDTVYGIHIRDKIASGKASFEYTFSKNLLRINTENIRRFYLDLSYFDIPDTKMFKIRLNGKVLDQTKIKQTQHTWEVSVPLNKTQINSKTNYQKVTPINAVFRERFAIVRPDSSSNMVEGIIQAMDSIWRKEYLKNIRIICESEIPNELEQGSHLVHIRTLGISNALSSVPGVRFYQHTDIENKKQHLQNFSYAFVSSNEEGSLRLLIGGADGKVSKKFLEEIIRHGWQSSVVWNNKVEQPLTSLNYMY